MRYLRKLTCARSEYRIISKELNEVKFVIVDTHLAPGRFVWAGGWSE